MKIIFAGWGGVGKGDAGKILAHSLGYKFISVGDFFRGIASELNISATDLENLAKIEPKYDIDIDTRTKEFGRKNDDFILDGRIAHEFIPDSVKILLVCDDQERFRRISIRDKVSIPEAKRLTLHREKTAKERYAKLYKIGDYNPRDFDLVIDTTTIPAKEVAFRIQQFLTKGEGKRKQKIVC